LNLGLGGGRIAEYARTILGLCPGIIGKTFRAGHPLIKYATARKQAFEPAQKAFGLLKGLNSGDFL
jgi:hypothetical protein